MAKKSGLMKTTSSIAGTSGKGAFSFREVSAPSVSTKHQRGTNSVLANSKGGNVQRDLKRIGGESGMGPFRAREVMTGSKCMSTKHPGLDTAKPSRMSCAHTLTGNVPESHNMNQGGSNRIGAGTRTFKKEAYPTAGPRSNYPRHAGQPSGHKDKA